MELTEITLKMIVQAGLMEPETIIYSSTKPPVAAKVNSDGSITVPLNRTYPSPSGAAKAITNSSINGWKFWTVLVNNEYKLLSFFREEYKRHIDNVGSLN